MSVIQWWLTYFYNAASEYLISPDRCRAVLSNQQTLASS